MRKRREIAELAGVAQERVQFSPTLEDRRTKTIDCNEVLEIEGYQRGAAAQRLDFVIRVFETTHGPRNENDVRTGRSERLCGSATDPSRRTRHERNPSIKRLRHAVNSPQRHKGHKGRICASLARRAAAPLCVLWVSVVDELCDVGEKGELTVFPSTR